MKCFCVVLAFLSPLVLAQEIRLSTGSVDNQVYQRGADNTTLLKLGGTADKLTGKSVEARLTSGSKPVRGFGWKSLTKIEGSTWSAELKGVPTGGPYNLELRAPGAPAVIVKDLLVGDLWVLAGQSNMEGVGNLLNVQAPDPKVHSFTMSDEWTLAKEPLHELAAATDSVHWRDGRTAPLQGPDLAKYRENRKKGSGLELPFAVEMVKRTGVPIGLIPCAHGGTSMTQWDPALRDQGGKSLYGGMYRRFQALGGPVKGLLWYQGEADANAKAEPLYRDKFVAFIQAVRRDFNQPDLPFYYVQIGRHVAAADNQVYWNRVQNTERTVEGQLTNVGVVSALDYPLDDPIHVGTPGLKLLAVRLANLATRDLFPEVKQYASIKRGPRIQTASYTPGSGPAGIIKVSFAEVNSALQSTGPASGFSVLNADGQMVPMIYRVDLNGSDAILQVQGKLPPGATLAYGWTKDPYCNVSDGSAMGVLAFSGVAISQ
ncbi:MAG: sialate O-acetylesterase [Bryobacteraceae bacterium]|nr:sialate O-acetylesterase [Bryobacteraceae bacterium]